MAKKTPPQRKSQPTVAAPTAKTKPRLPISFDCVPAIFYRGLYYECLQNYDEAVRNYAAVTRINPEYPVRGKKRSDTF